MELGFDSVRASLDRLQLLQVPIYLPVITGKREDERGRIWERSETRKGGRGGVGRWWWNEFGEGRSEKRGVGRWKELGEGRRRVRRGWSGKM